MESEDGESTFDRLLAKICTSIRFLALWDDSMSNKSSGVSQWCKIVRIVVISSGMKRDPAFLSVRKVK